MASTADILQVLKMDAKFQKACEQVLVLNNMVKEPQIRYDIAARDNLRTYRYALRLRLCTVEGLRNTLYDYVAQKVICNPTEIDQIVLPFQRSF